MMITLLGFLQIDKGTLSTSRMRMYIRFASAVDMLPIDNGVGHEKLQILQGIREPLQYTT